MARRLAREIASSRFKGAPPSRAGKVHAASTGDYSGNMLQRGPALTGGEGLRLL